MAQGKIKDADINTNADITVSKIGALTGINTGVGGSITGTDTILSSTGKTEYRLNDIESGTNSQAISNIANRFLVDGNGNIITSGGNILISG